MSPAKKVGGRASGVGRNGGTALRRRVGVALKAALVLGAVWFAVEGGEYGTFDLVRQRRAEARLRTEIDSLARVVDSLEAYHKRLQTDPVVQERIAREEFGMVRGPHEIIYRFAEPADSGSRAGRP